MTQWPSSILAIQFHAPQTRPTASYPPTQLMGKRKADNFIASDDDDQDFDESESEASPSSEEVKKSKSKKVHLNRTTHY